MELVGVLRCAGVGIPRGLRKLLRRSTWQGINHTHPCKVSELLNLVGCEAEVYPFITFNSYQEKVLREDLNIHLEYYNTQGETQ